MDSFQRRTVLDRISPRHFGGVPQSLLEREINNPKNGVVLAKSGVADDETKRSLREVANELLGSSLKEWHCGILLDAGSDGSSRAVS